MQDKTYSNCEIKVKWSIPGKHIDTWNVFAWHNPEFMVLLSVVQMHMVHDIRILNGKS